MKTTFPDANDLALIGVGDEAVVRRAFERFSPMVYGIARQITKSHADAEDVLQDVFIGLPDALQSFDGDDFTGWLKVVVARRAMMLVRAERRRRRYTLEVVGPGSVEKRVLSGMAVRGALREIDPLLRAVFVLRVVEGYSHDEIAAMMEITPNLSRVRLFRARSALRELLVE